MGNVSAVNPRTYKGEGEGGGGLGCYLYVRFSNFFPRR